MTGPAAALLADGRLHLQHGPIDLIIGAVGDADEVRRAYSQVTAAFDGVLEGLAAELPLLKAPIAWPPTLTLPHKGGGDRNSAPSPSMGEGWGGGDALCPTTKGPIARRMIAAVWPYRAVFITPMAAVAGAVADAMLAAMVAGRDLRRAYVNDGGDIAIHLAPGEAMRVGVAGSLEDGEPDAALDGFATIDSASPARGIATSGRGGRSLSLGIADSVTILAASGAAADAAATIVGNAVNVDSQTIRRLPANQVKDDSDLGDIPVTVAVGPLSDREIAHALDSGAAEAERLRTAGLIHGALLRLRGARLVVGVLHPSRRAFGPPQDDAFYHVGAKLARHPEEARSAVSKDEAHLSSRTTLRKRA
ncbi:MAG: UPF0280 family protein [Alphaproteobacteria bacterium]|nr:UPF0280 family protein [Alphaproteobacteria bacterium]